MMSDLPALFEMFFFLRNFLSSLLKDQFFYPDGVKNSMNIHPNKVFQTSSLAYFKIKKHMNFVLFQNAPNRLDISNLKLIHLCRTQQYQTESRFSVLPKH